MNLLHKEVLAGGNSAIIITRHNPVITGGFLDKGKFDSVKNLYYTDRGGGLTFHDPGQIVFYPIINFQRAGIKQSNYIDFLQNWISNAMSSLGIPTDPNNGNVGTWVGGRKVAFIGVRIKQGVSLHGFSINLNTDLSGFNGFSACNCDWIEVGNLGLDHTIMISALLDTLNNQFKFN